VKTSKLASIKPFTVLSSSLVARQSMKGYPTWDDFFSGKTSKKMVTAQKKFGLAVAEEIMQYVKFI
jgi:hypothetical protein